MTESDTKVPRVSIVAPVYNARDHVTGALNRLRQQSFADFEVVVVDDASTDDSLTLIEQQADADSRITVVRMPSNGGVAHARNEAIKHARGEWLWFVDIDDEWSPHLLRRLVNVADSEHVDAVFCSADHLFGRDAKRREAIVTYEEAATHEGVRAIAITLEGTGALWNKLIRRRSVPLNAFPPLRSKSDHAGLIRMIPNLRSIATIPETLYTYVQRDGSISNGGVRQPSNFLILLDLAEDTLSSLPHTDALRRSRARFRCEILGRALRECWRFPETNSGLVVEIQQRLTWADIVAARSNRRAFISCASAKISPRLAGRFFRFIGRRRWTALGAN